MSITQTVEVPPNHRLVVDVPPEVPSGPTVIVFRPVADLPPGKTAQEAAGGWLTPPFDPVKAMEAIERCSGLFKRMGINLSSDEFLEMRRKDKELEDRLDRQ